MLVRQLRNKTMRLYCLAIAIACGVTLSITLLGDRLEQLFDIQAKEVLAADLVLQSSSVLTEQQQIIIQSFNLNRAETLTFRTMATANDEFLLSSVKAVSNHYPLVGELQVADELYGATQSIQSTPGRGEAWVEDRVLNELGLQLNQFIRVGEQSLKLTRVLVYEPDRGNSFYSFTPRILMNMDDVVATGIVKPGSRVVYRYLFTGDETQLESLQNQLASSLELNQQFVSVTEANQTLSATLERAYRFLNMTALIAVLLGAVAAALVSFQYANEMTYQYAIFRCLGLQGKRMTGTVVIPLLIYTVLAILIGFLIGEIAHSFILQSLDDLIPKTLPEPSIKPYLLSALTAVIVVISFVWPFLQKLLKTQPKRLLNRLEVQEQSFLITIVAIMTGLSILIYLATRDIMISAYVIAMLFGFIVIAYFVTRTAIALFEQYSRSRQASFKLAARSLKANQRMVVVQVIAIALTFFSLALISTIRDDLVSSWQSKIPDDAPNIFVINLFEDDKQTFFDELTKRKLGHSPVYPIARGRLSAVNDVPIREYASKETERQDESLGRDLSLTWSSELAADNEIVQGEWHDSKIDTGENSVSVEQGLAENLEIKLGDRLTFTIETKTVTAVVSSIRTVEWESFMPNFYMIFSPGTLDNFPITYLSSFLLESEERVILREFVSLFPSATFFDVDFLLNRIRGISEKISYAVEMVLYFALVSCLLVFISIELILRQYRIYSTAIFKAVGASTSLLQRIFRIEFLLVGFIAGIVAYLLNVIVSFAISNYIIEGDFILNIKTAILCIIIAPLMVLLAGFISIHRTKQVSVNSLLRES